ncbi:hypothetical protein CIPAW_04G183800 [Carya illinoinensis]|uniref:Uncharacterized protein n=1 Tax=Carya illinoinensis TaxID=32201 RepID=A0A8T1QWW0_CARIL|nr:hypothetical protein CIPAW_04G183800 [Carya illinoinensis]
MYVGKNSWPELVGESGEATTKKIEAENGNMHVNVLLEGTRVIKDFRCDMVRVWVKESGIFNMNI